ncbi:DUF1499 domain-containing protein [Neptunomonas qingdaonensis]|uniref:Uncharacterized conserved protein, DUF1499 family n=1 Tax=Neptunomonas qingdaonensis TaxID=1045558 RepID=A0A1I2TA44_9GAMM|nr:DUF1499 domain-containing protein [Neptunomonas qingdaonensis]SFG59466.1 Uncharacterized conserved protein, DUF1499 family [Neptunomonas qingdaonensis]
MKLALSIIVVVFTLITIYFFVLGYLSKKGSPIGLVDSRLAQCEQKPNCVCSEYPDDHAHFVLPLTLPLSSDGSLPPSSAANLDVAAAALKHSPEDIIRIAKEAILAMGGKVQPVDDSQRGASFYLAATFQSTLFGFVDDVELRVDSQDYRLHFRSASRVGHSDFGANLKRIEKLKNTISARLAEDLLVDS